MYEHLDPAEPGGPSRDGVFARAAALSRRRRLVAGGAALSVALLAAVPLAVHDGGSPRRQTIAAGDEPSAGPEPESPSAEPEPESEPSSEEPTTPATAAPASAEPSQPTPSGSYDGWPGDRPDGEPGWSSGFAWCTPSSARPQVDRAESQPPVAGMTIALELPRTAFRAGAEVLATVRMRNDTNWTVRFTYRHDDDAEVSGPGDAAWHSDDAIRVARAELAPGEETAFTIPVPTVSCGDTSGDPEPPLSPGRYTAFVAVSYDDVSTAAPPSPTASPGLAPLPPSPPQAQPLPPMHEQGGWYDAPVEFELT